MTPLSRFFERLLPRPLAIVALAMAYAGMMFSVLVAGEVEQREIIYIDVHGD